MLLQDTRGTWAGALDRGNIDSLTGLRFLAALWVVGFHYRFELAALVPVPRVVETLLEAGYLGVDLFFVLSGFILAYNYLAQFQTWSWPAFRRFLWLRFARIYPLHLFTLLVLALPILGATLLGKYAPGEGFSVRSFLENLLLVHAWFGEPHSWNGPAWSISAEWFAYLTFPVAALLVNRVRAPLAKGIGAMAAFALMLAFFALGHFGANPLAQISGEFLAGCFLGQLYLHREVPRWRWDAVSLVVVLALLGGLLGLRHLGWSLMGITPLFGVLILAVGMSEGLLASILGSRVFVFWGEASYALYMTHEVMHMIGQKVLHLSFLATAPLVVRSLVALTALIGLLAVAAGTYRLVEAPSRRFLRSLMPPAAKGASGASH